MTRHPEIDASRRRVWMAFADQFLDTETRHDLPMAALAAVEAGLSPEEARDVWRLEVAPAVGANLLSVAGEWAGWDEAWLVDRICAARHRRRRGLLARLARRVPDLNHRSWDVVEGCMRALLAAPPADRRALARDLHALARHYFDFCPRPLDAARRGELRRLFDEVARPSFAGVVYRLAGESRPAFERRVEAALDAGPG